MCFESHETPNHFGEIQVIEYMLVSLETWYEWIGSFWRGRSSVFPIASNDSDIDLVSSPSGYDEFIMKLSTSPSSSFCKEVLSLDSLCLDNDWMEAFVWA